MHKMSKVTIKSELQYSKVQINENQKDFEKPKSPRRYGYGIRHGQLFICFSCVVTSFMARSHLGVTIVAMTSETSDAADATRNGSFTINNYTDYNKADDIEYMENININKMNETDRYITASNTANVSDVTAQPRSLYSIFNWPKSIQELVLTAFFTGYCIGMMPASLACQRWGGKVPLQVSMFVNGVISIITPTLTYWGNWQAVCACRFLQGLFQAGTYPGLQTLMAQWVPNCEKGTLTSYVYTGATTGSVVGLQISGLTSAAAGWPAPFWVTGALSLLMFLVLTVYGAASPRVHGTISEEERAYIIEQTTGTALRPARVPWCAMVKSKPLLANWFTSIGSGVSFIFFFTQVPSYLHYIYGIDVKNSGMLSSLPYTVSIFASLSYGVITDYLINHNIVTRKNGRRYSNLFAQTGMALSLVGASYASSTTTAVVFFVTFMVTHMATHTGWMVNQIDLSPNYSGVMIAVTNLLYNFVVMLMPLIISNVIVDMGNVFQWRILMYLEATLAFIPSVIFAIFISDEVQPWNEGRLSEGEIKSMQLEKADNRDINLKKIIK